MYQGTSIVLWDVTAPDTAPPSITRKDRLR